MKNKEVMDSPGWSLYNAFLSTFFNLSKKQRIPTAILNSTFSGPQQKALMKTKVVSKIFIWQREKSSRSVVRIERWKLQSKDPDFQKDEDTEPILF